MPAFQVTRTGGNQSLTTGGWNKIAFNSVISDTNSWYDATTNYRYTPQIAGYYQFNLIVFCQASSGLSVGVVAIGKNGLNGLGLYGTYTKTPTPTAGAFVSCGLLYMNGSTDYVDTLIFCDGASPFIGGPSSELQTAGNVYLNMFSGFLVRPD
jgi:hypothetical protein